MKRDTFERLKKMGIDFDDDFENLMVKPLEKQSERIEEKKEEDVDRYDFLPIVKVNNSEDAKNAIISVKENETYKKDKIDLGADYDKDKRDYLVADIIITQNSVARIPLMVKRGFDPWGLQDDDGVLTFECSNSSVKLKFIDREDTDYKDNAKEYNLNKAANGDVFVMEITPSSLKRGTKFTITVYASDNDDWTRNKSIRRGICGKFNLKVVEQDVFMEDEYKKGLNEILLIAEKYNKRPISGEYSVNYCIQAADRFLGKVVDNNKNFYAYDDKTNTLTNVPSLENAIKRAIKIKELGYGKVYKEFLGNIFSIKEESKKDEYGNNPTRTLILKPQSGVKQFVQDQIGKNIGYHIFYLSIVEAFHTLILIIDNTEPSDTRYEIYDEQGLSSSKGIFDNIESGLTAQSQWVYRWVKPRYGYWAKLNISLLKFQRK